MKNPQIEIWSIKSVLGNYLQTSALVKKKKKKKAQNFQESWSFSRLECYVICLEQFIKCGLKP